MEKSLIKGGKVILPGGVIRQDVSVLIVDGRVAALVPCGEPDPENCAVVDACGQYVSPGFIDIHLHGGGGYDFMDGTLEAFLGIAQIHAQHGTTALCPTTLTCPDEELFRLFDIRREALKCNDKGAQLLGFHLEGPYFSKSQAGAQDPKYLVPLVKEHYEKIYEAAQGDIVRWSIAPELPGSMQFIKDMSSRGILVSQAHTQEIYEQAVEAYECGANLATHMYCAMSTITRDKGFRHAGLIEAAYLLDGMNVEIIADGCHLPKELLQFVMKFKGVEKTALITDAIRAAGQDVTETILGSLSSGQRILVEDGVAKLPDRSVFAGSVCTSDRLVRTMVNVAEVPLTDAVKMASLIPARFIGLDGCKGSIEPGKDADIVIFGDNINVTRTIVGGKTVFAK